MTHRKESPGTPGRQDILVIIPYYKRKDQLDRCLAHLNQQISGARIKIFIRDNSSDNIFFTKAVNEGLRHGMEEASYRYFFLLNQDCYLMPSAVEHLVQFMEKHPHAGLAGPIQRNAGNPGNLLWAGSVDSFPFGQHRTAILRDANGLHNPYPTPWANGAALMLRRETVRDCGLLDHNMEFICSDVDYSFTARTRGWQCYVVPQSECLHEGGASVSFDDDPTRQRKLLDMKFFCEKWISGNLYRSLATEGAKMTPEYMQLVYRNIMEKLQETHAQTDTPRG